MKRRMKLSMKRFIEHPENVPEWLALAREAERNANAFARTMRELRALTAALPRSARLAASFALMPPKRLRR